MFAGLDAVVYDVQDLGNRSYTFISTLGYVMDEAAKDHIEVIVLDRPNPLGGVRIEGPRLNPAAKSFVGLYDIPLVYGLTPGELAQWINARYLPAPCRLTVVPNERLAARDGLGGHRPALDSDLAEHPDHRRGPRLHRHRISGRNRNRERHRRPAALRSGGGLGLEYERAGRALQRAARSGRARPPLTVTGGQPVRRRPAGDRSRNAGNLTAISFQFIEILQRMVRGFSAFAHTKGDQREMFDKVSGQPSIRAQLVAGRPVSSIVRSWDSGVARWAQERLPYLLYGNGPRRAVKVATDGADASR